jgi:hypothetical protein
VGKQQRDLITIKRTDCDLTEPGAVFNLPDFRLHSITDTTPRMHQKSRRSTGNAIFLPMEHGCHPVHIIFSRDIRPGSGTHFKSAHRPRVYPFWIR